MIKDFMVFNRKYFINDNGDVFNAYGKKLSKRKGREYPYVEMMYKKDGKRNRKRFFVHRLVAEFFIPNPHNLPQVNHKDGNKDNYQLSNLEWVTASENQSHSRYVLKNVTGFEDVAVICIETGKHYKSTREAWRDTGAGFSHISECIKGKRKTAGGYHWRKAA